MVAALGALTRCENPRALMTFLGRISSEYSTGERRRQGSMTTAGNTHARRALVAGAWASRYPAKVRHHLQLRLEKLPKPLQDISWKAQVRLCNRSRRLIARGKQAKQVVVAIARELVGFLWAIATEVPVTPSPHRPMDGQRNPSWSKWPMCIGRDAAPVWCHPRRREETYGHSRPSSRGRHPTEARKVVPHP